MASCLYTTRLVSPREQSSMATMISSQHPFERLATFTRQSSTKPSPLGYRPSKSSLKKDPTAPPTGFAAIGSYNTIARRYGLSNHGASFSNGFQVDCYYGGYSFCGGDKLHIVPTRYWLCSVHLHCAKAATVILGREQKPLESRPEGPLTAKHN